MQIKLVVVVVESVRWVFLLVKLISAAGSVTSEFSTMFSLILEIANSPFKSL